MKIIPVSKVLEDYRLNAPLLNVLEADANNYSILLFQPKGQIEATKDRIGNRDHALCFEQFGKFLEQAMISQADLVVTPEYSTPWGVLRKAIEDANGGLKQGKLWALGCESIKYSELQAFRDDIADKATVIFEDLEQEENRFVDPLAYVFRTIKTSDGELSKPIVLVQFKSHAMADRHDFEKNRIQLGQKVYQFGNYGAGISLMSLICSDVFAFTDALAQQVYDRALILHIQLNPEPRNDIFLGCRAKLLGITGDSTEILCLNWARNVDIWIDNIHTQWQDISGSAWYGKMAEFDSDDSTLSQNHRRGLYYSFYKTRHAHTQFLNFDPAVYQLTANKVVRLGVPGAVGTRRGPQLDNTFVWDGASHTWTTCDTSNDEFLDIVKNCGCAENQVKTAFIACPLACERLLALVAGNADVSLEWYLPKRLDSFELDRSELIRRITFCQDHHADANQFRLKRLSRCAQLLNILVTHQQIPQSLIAGPDGFILDWSITAPHQNLLCAGGERATVMYIGEDSDNATRERTYKAARERIHRSLDEESVDRAKQRVVLWYRDTSGNLQRRWDPPAIDRAQDESEYDIGRMK